MRVLKLRAIDLDNGVAVSKENLRCGFDHACVRTALDHCLRDGDEVDLVWAPEHTFVVTKEHQHGP